MVSISAACASPSGGSRARLGAWVMPTAVKSDWATAWAAPRFPDS